MGSTTTEIARDQWALLRDLYAGDRKNLTGFDLLEYFINYQPLSDGESIKIYTTDKNWSAHGNYILIHKMTKMSFLYLNTIRGSLKDLGYLLCSLKIKGFHLINAYGEDLKPLVEQYWLKRGQDLNKLEHPGAVVYHLPSSEVENMKTDGVNPSFKVDYLSLEHVNLIDQHWAYRSDDSLTLIRGLMEHHVSAGVFNSSGEPLAWCLRSPHGSLGNLHVLTDHRRKGLGSMVVQFIAKEILKTGSEVLATVLLENKSSRNMFEKLGFRPINILYWAVIP
ncbi:uncharacterized protein Glyat [Drosophila bipectinata]|uniref:uncharacterized protein Glyat n=1 Tax=Drosophila bipectinata TaxID=42026 RepID=UPI001C88F0A1|nr:uncharacterized protein LOC108125877 [Drosophila bipectinata]